ncbi:glucose-6-phosphate 1-dehydrogenase-like isoform X2 [Phymastichus coffea]|uniref:glucose-6-phosphate 1-dehydrogenase-like isoform X2 n=1 Tax=Phymastichus coffea TaxID=108790 RepID=UPI00273BC220|nr:glucose-6-phosphate 1-dehydrogenase-like isoform X2 [Phymastichus coffea]
MWAISGTTRPRLRSARKSIGSEASECIQRRFGSPLVRPPWGNDLSKREIYPSLWYLYREQLLPKNTRIFGYARRQRTIDYLRGTVEPYVTVNPGEEELYDQFWQLNSYVAGSDGSEEDYRNVDRAVSQFEDGEEANRIFYLALPPAVFVNSTRNIKAAAMAKNGWTRVVLEKPFGRDSESSDELSRHVSSLFTEDQLYRMDHFLGYEVVQNILTLRFGNRIFTPAWNNENIASIEMDFRENFGVEGRGSFFDANNIIRDVMQNHLLQIMSLIAMERPKSNSSDDIRDAKVDLLRYTKAIVMDDVVLGQYVANTDSQDPRERIGYRDDPTVPDHSNTSTFALTVLRVENERWRGVPFIIRAGKSLNVNQTDVIVQFKNVPDNLFGSQPIRNKLVIRVKGSEGIQVKIMSKVPGYKNDIEEIVADFNYEEDYKNKRIPEAYQKLILNVFEGSQSNFVRSDELKEAWRIFTPILYEIENNTTRPIEYKFGTTGPKEADEMERRNNFLRN